MNARGLKDAADDDRIRAIFRATLAMGAGVAFVIPDLDRYEALCLDWYLGPGRDDAAVLEAADGRVGGYALVCTSPDAHRRWTRRHAARFAVMVVAGFARGRYRGEAARFYRFRMHDGWSLRTRPAAVTGLGHAHVNLVPALRAGRAGRVLAAHIDDRVSHAGLPGWFGEINAVSGHRAAALERLGGTVVHRAPNRTMSELTGLRVDRLTVVRSLGIDAVA